MSIKKTSSFYYGSSIQSGVKHMTIGECIVMSEAVEEGGSRAFNNLSEQAQELVDVDNFLSACKDAEDNWMYENHSHDSNAKKKDGEWKYRTYLPGAYTSGKSVIVGAMKLQLPLNGQGKSALQKAIKEAKAVNVKSAYDKCMTAINTVIKNIADVTDQDELFAIKEKLEELV